MKRLIPVAKPSLTEAEIRAMARVVRSGWITQGPEVEQFEKEFATFVGAPHAVATSSATTGLSLALELIGVGTGDEVIVPSFTFIASVNVIIHTGATAVFADIEERTFNVDPTDVAKKVTNKTRAILFVDQFGLPADIDRLKRIAKDHSISIIEDAACALGSTYKGKRIGRVSPISVFSFHPRKLLTTGDGGMLVATDPKLAKRAKVLRNQGMSISDLERHSSKKIIFEHYDEAGYNFRLTDVAAAMGRVQLQRFGAMLERRQKQAHRYDSMLTDVPHLGIPYVPHYAKPNYQSYVVTLEADAPLSRDDLMAKLLKKGIATRRGAMAIHLEPYYKKKFTSLSLPLTEKAAKTTIVLPLYHDMTTKDQNYVASSIRTLLE